MAIELSINNADLSPCSLTDTFNLHGPGQSRGKSNTEVPV